MEPDFESHVMWFLLGYSFLMFTLPFVGFFTMKYFLGQILNIQGYKVIAISVIFAVIIVQLIIYSYVKQAFNEPVDKVDDGGGHEDEKEFIDDKKDQ
ncbi:uncharacterized protein LOC112681952 [Sipha flava]|jgi:hypothetical protein|uniref:Uncharacterized protein LOC112681952 n=1 Tax=Sipha flava TaxID=143950 RepID=A0A8B8FCQ4_9HEMI|nr:uncharacterized protein LOC112681952 [Sipha flava]